MTLGLATALFLAFMRAGGWRVPWIALLPVVLGSALALHLTARGWVRAADAMLVSLPWLAATGIAYENGFVAPMLAGYGVTLVASGLLLGTRAVLAFALLSGVALAGLLALPRPDAVTLAFDLSGRRVLEVGVMVASAALVYASWRRTRDLLQEARLSELRHTELLEHSGELLSEASPDGTLIWVSPNHQVQLGFRPEKLVGRNALELIHPEDRERLRTPPGSQSALGSARNLEFRVVGADGSWHWMETVAQTFRREGSEPRWCAITRDVTERKRAEQQLRDSEERFRALTENAQEIVAELGEGRVLYVSPSAMGLLGYPPDRVRDDWVDLIHPDDRDRARAALASVAGDRESLEMTLRVRDSAGSWRALECSGQAFYTSAGGRRAVMIARDVSARRELEMQFLQAQKLAALARLAGGIAHDFNNLLTVIQGYCESLLDEQTPQRGRSEAVQEIQAAAERASALVRQILAFSRHDDVEPEVLDLNRVVLDLERMLQRLIGEDVTLVSRVHGARLWVDADPSRLEQVITNLVVNARDAVAAGDRIEIETGLDGSGDLAVLSVRDTGAGMDAATAERIFEPFFTTKPPGKGTGLGLATVHGIVTQAGGRVEVESEVGAGSTFRVSLPRVRDASIRRPPRLRERAPLPRAGATVLVVEDESSVRALVRRCLESRGYRVLEASDGEQALRLATAHRGAIDLLLTDVVMPHMDGAELREKLRLQRPATRALFMSGYAERPSSSGSSLERCRPLIPKPFTADRLAGAVAAILDGPRAAP